MWTSLPQSASRLAIILQRLDVGRRPVNDSASSEVIAFGCEPSEATRFRACGAEPGVRRPRDFQERQVAPQQDSAAPRPTKSLRCDLRQLPYAGHILTTAHDLPIGQHRFARERLARELR